MSEVTFTPASEDWGTVTHCALFLGNEIIFYDLSETIWELAEMGFVVDIWCDGSANNMTREGGWAAIIVAREETVSEAEIAELINLTSDCPIDSGTIISNYTVGDTMNAKVVILRGKEDDTTSNRMEITAALEALKYMKKPCKLTFYMDSTYTIGVLSGSYWARKNLDLVGEWQQHVRAFDVSYKHVDGHTGNLLNEWADRLASYRSD